MRISTFEKLELVVALHGSPRATSSIDELSRTLKLPKDAIRQTAIELRAAALVELTSRGEVQLLPPTEHDRAALAELVRLYAEDRMTIVKALGEIAMERLRSMAARAFSEAFILRKKPPKDGSDG